MFSFIKNKSNIIISFIFKFHINIIKFNTSLDPLRHYVPTLDSPWRME